MRRIWNRLCFLSKKVGVNLYLKNSRKQKTGHGKMFSKNIKKRWKCEGIT